LTAARPVVYGYGRETRIRRRGKIVGNFGFANRQAVIFFSVLLRLFLLFTSVTLLELFLLIRLDALVTFWPTVALVIGTCLLGAWLSRQQGRKVISQWRGAMTEGKLPEEGVLSGLLVLVGSVLLVTPGVLTDLVGLSLLVPKSRHWLAGILRVRLAQKMKDGTVRVVAGGVGGVPVDPQAANRPRQAHGRVIETEEQDQSET